MSMRMNPAFLDFASRLLASEDVEAGPTSQGDEVEATEKAFRKLRGRLARLLGQEGFDSLLSRALYLAASEYSFLENVTVEVSQSSPNESRQLSTSHLKGLREGIKGQDRAEVRAGLDAMLGCFIGLLSTFIGEDLAFRQLRRIWPEILPQSAGDRGGSGPEEARP
jgi:hypothetical protein